MSVTTEAIVLRSVDSARETIVGAVAHLSAMTVAIDDALGLVLAEDVRAPLDVPPFANSAMDGYAVIASDTVPASAASPVGLEVIGEAPAGVACPIAVESGTAIRIMTGAPIPRGADAVVRFEDVEEPPAATHLKGRRSILVSRMARKQDNIRPAGEDVEAGQMVLSVGTPIRPAEIGMLASMGCAEIRVHRRPRIAVLATGDELVAPGGALGPGQIYNSNTSTICALVRRTGGESVALGIARDTTEDLRRSLRHLLDIDLILTTGGVSVGDYDLVKHVLQREGIVDLWQVRIKPGKPLAFGSLDEVPLIGLPGNPVAAAVAFEQFARPAIQRMLGHRAPSIPTVQARLLDRIENRGGRRHFVRARTWLQDGSYVSTRAGRQGSAIMTSLVNGNSLVVVPEDCPVAEPGMMVEAQMLDW
jgi:molybdopterin molybdotransferase